MRAVAILHAPDFAFGSVRLRYRHLAEVSASRGDPFDVVTPERFPISWSFHHRFRVLLLPFAAAFWLWRRRRQYDVALFHSYAGWVFNFLPAGIPTITVFHGLEPLFFDALQAEHRAQGRRLSLRYRFAFGWMMPRILGWSCRRSTRVFCSNQAEATFLVDRGWTSGERVFVYNHTVAAPFFVDDRMYAPRATKLLFVSQWLDTKGIRYLVDAFARVARTHADLELLCCGTIVPEDRVRQSFPADVRDRVFARPTLTLSELAAVHRDADIFIHASLSEGFGTSIAEARASALPVVVTPVGSAKDRCRDEHDCLMVPIADASALAKAIERLIDDEALRRRLGQAARRAMDDVRPGVSDIRFLDEIRAAGR